MASMVRTVGRRFPRRHRLVARHWLALRRRCCIEAREVRCPLPLRRRSAILRLWASEGGKSAGRPICDCVKRPDFGAPVRDHAAAASRRRAARRCGTLRRPPRSSRQYRAKYYGRCGGLPRRTTRRSSANPYPLPIRPGSSARACDGERWSVGAAALALSIACDARAGAAADKGYTVPTGTRPDRAARPPDGPRRRPIAPCTSSRRGPRQRPQRFHVVREGKTGSEDLRQAPGPENAHVA